MAAGAVCGDTLYQPVWVMIKIVGKIQSWRKKKSYRKLGDCGASAPALTGNHFRDMGIFHSQPGPKMMRNGRAISSFFRFLSHKSFSNKVPILLLRSFKSL